MLDERSLDLAEDVEAEGHGARLRACLALAVVCLASSLWLGPAEAGAVVARIHNHGFGVTPRRGVSPASIAGAYRPSRPPVSETRSGVQGFAEVPGGNLKYFGGPVMHSNTTHVVYWDPGGEFTSTTKGIVQAFFSEVAHDSGLARNVFGVDAQFTDGTGNAAYSSTFSGALTDAASYPTSGCTVPKVEADPGPPYTHCLTDAQLQTQLEAFIGKEELPTGPTQLYFVLLPHKVVTCFPGSECSNNVFCAYHSYIKPGTAGEIIYADIPFSLLDTESAKGCQFDENSGIQTPNGDRTGTDSTTRFADVALKYVSHEYSEAITDPLVGGEVAGKETTAWVDSFGFENGDKCNATGSGEDGLNASAFKPVLGGSAAEDDVFDQTIDEGHFYLQSEWDNAAKGCLMQPLAISAPSFTSSAARAGSPVSFSGSATDPYTHLKLAWDFGDGSHGEGTAPTHTYSAPGEYTVTMSSKDGLTGSTGSVVSHTVVVAAAEGGGEPGGGGGGGGGEPGGGVPTEPVGGGGETSGTVTSSGGVSGATSGAALASPLTPVPPVVSATVALAGSSLSVRRNGQTSVRLSCTGTASVCTGELTLLGKAIVRIKGRSRTRVVTLLKAPFTIHAGATTGVPLRLAPAARALLRSRGGRLTATLAINKRSPAPASTLTAAVRLKLAGRSA